MATLTTIPTQAGTEHIRVLLTMSADAPATFISSQNLQASQAYVTQTGDAVFASNISLNGINPHQPSDSQGDIRLRRTGAAHFSNWRAQQSETPKLLYASSADSDTVRQATEGSVGGGFWNWFITGLPQSAQSGPGTTINLVIYSPPGAAPVVYDRAAAFTLGTPSFSAVLGKFDVTLYGLVAGFTLGAPTFGVALGKTTLATHDSAAGFALGVPSFAAVLGKRAIADHDSAASFALGAPAFSAVLGKEVVGLISRTADFSLGVPLFSAVLGKRAVAAHASAAAFALGVPSFSVVLGARAIASHDSQARFNLGVPLFSAVLGLEDATTQDREASLVLGAPAFSVDLGKTALGVHDISAAFALGGLPTFAVVLAKRIPADRTGPIAVALTSGVATLKSVLLAGGLLRSVEWRRRTGKKDVRGRQAVTTKLIDAFIEQRPALDRSASDTERSDDTVLTILDPVAITDSDTFKWGGHIYKVSKIDGVVKNESTGVRFSSEVTVIR